MARLPLFNEEAALRALERAIRRWRMLGTRRLAQSVLSGTGTAARAGARTIARRAVPLLALGDPTISRLMIGWMADLGHKEQLRRKEKNLGSIGKVNAAVTDTLLRIGEGGFALLAAGVEMVDAMTDAVLPDGLLQDAIDVPEEAIRDAISTLSKMSRALRTGERNGNSPK